MTAKSGVVAAALAALFPALGVATEALAQPAGCPGGVVATLPQVQGAAFVVRGDGGAPVAVGAGLCSGDIIQTSTNSRLTLVLEDTLTVVRVDEDTRLVVDTSAAEPGAGAIRLLEGAMYFLSRVPRVLTVETPFVNAGIEGTEVLVRVEDGREEWLVIEGEVAVATALGDRELGDGTRVEVAADRLEVTPPDPDAGLAASFGRDALAWTLFYPPVLVAGADATPAVRDIVDALDAGQSDRALAQLSLLSDTGTEGETKRALQAAIAVARRDPETALELVAADDPTQPVTAIARSYALQAQARLDEAREAIRTSALGAGEDDALVQARLAELELAFGERGAARLAGDRASEIEQLGLTRTVQGFAALANYETRGARRAFEEAIALDDADPLARLGLGLAKIRGGDLEAGKRELEVAVVLDPERALLRSYVGKAYAEAFLEDEAEAQLEIAKGLDPTDPTPWYYDALRKADANRPVEALADLEAAQARNDGRAVTRSRLLLDQDRAARSADIARIYDQLGLDQLALSEASAALRDDPASFAAHRFLADAFAERPRSDLARASSAFRADLLSPPSRTLVSPLDSISFVNTTAQADVLQPGLNEFTRFFESEGVAFRVDGFGGTQETFGNQALASAHAGPFSIALGQTFSDTEGWRNNNNITNLAYRGQLKWAPTANIDFTLDAFTRESEFGFIDFNFDEEPNVVGILPFDQGQVVFFNDELQQTLDEHGFTIGTRITPKEGQDFLIAITQGRSETTIESRTQEDIVIPGFPPFSTETERFQVERRQGTQIDAQYVKHGEAWNAQIGLMFQNANANTRNRSTNINDNFDIESDRDFISIYGYLDISPVESVTLTIGAAADQLQLGDSEVDALNPKVGLEWAPTRSFRLRAAAAQTVSRSSLVTDRTLEPMAIAGFGQYFDDFDGTEATMYAIGADWRLTPTLVAGAEVSFRRLDVPVFEANPVRDEVVGTVDQREDIAKAYLGWTPHPRWAFVAGAEYEQLFLTNDPDNFEPSTVKTLSLPLVARYADPSGWFVQAGGEFLHQDVARAGLTQSPSRSGTENTFLVDLAAGYQLPRRRGLVQLQVRNLLGTQFSYQDASYRVPEDQRVRFQRSPRYVPETSALLTVRLELP